MNENFFWQKANQLSEFFRNYDCDEDAASLVFTEIELTEIEHCSLLDLHACLNMMAIKMGEQSIGESWSELNTCADIKSTLHTLFAEEITNESQSFNEVWKPKVITFIDDLLALFPEPRRCFQSEPGSIFRDYHLFYRDTDIMIGIFSAGRAALLRRYTGD